MQSLLTCSVGGIPLAVPIDAVERILRMAALSPVPNPMPGVVGLLNIAGEVLPVVDPRPTLGVQSASADPAQYLLLLVAHGRYLLWVDEVERMIDAPLLPSPTASDSMLEAVAQIEGRVVAILDPSALDPTPADRATAEATE